MRELHPSHQLHFRRERLLKGLSQVEVARLVGVSQSSISLFEAGQTGVLSQEKVAKLAELLGIRLEELTSPEQDPARLWYCPECTCPGAFVIDIAGMTVRPFMMSAPVSVTKLTCVHCGGEMQWECGGLQCGKPIVPGSVCPACAHKYVTVPESLVQRIVEAQDQRRQYREYCAAPIPHYTKDHAYLIKPSLAGGN